METIRWLNKCGNGFQHTEEGEEEKEWGRPMKDWNETVKEAMEERGIGKTRKGGV